MVLSRLNHTKKLGTVYKCQKPSERASDFSVIVI